MDQELKKIIDKFRINQFAYIYDTKVKRAMKILVRDIADDGTARIECITYVHEDGTPCGEAHGEYLRNVLTLFGTPEEIYANRAKESEKLIQEYMNDIQTVDDLIRFPLDHSFDPTVDYNEYAIEAYKRKAKSLLGVNI